MLGIRCTSVEDRTFRSGGGVAAHVNTDLAVKHRADLEEPDIEFYVS